MLAPGTRFGSYEVVSALGAGGMGEVYRARDVRLKRDVALKMLPESLADDPDRLARFQREAEVLASLNHPNIAHMYRLEQDDRVQALVMELVEGPTLADRISQGPISVDEALAIAGQIVGALEAAHEQGIIHRDLKPANIKLRLDGVVKVLDFGLAKVLEPGDTAPGLSQSPTITSPAVMTGVGVLLGTAAYMSPEQAKGRPADRRSDVWAFGCVLYEMLTGRRAFEGEDVTETLAAIVMRDPDWTMLPVTTPAPVRRLLRRALQRDRRQRLADIADARLELQEADTSSDAPPPVQAPIGRYRVALGVVGLIAILSVVALWALWRRPGSAADSVLFEIAAPAGTTFGNRTLSLSPDGRHVAFVATSSDGIPRIWIRSMGSLEPRVLRGTENAATRGNVVSDLCWSPDSRSLAFFQEGTLKRIDISGEASQTLCEMCGEPGSWGPDGVILTWAIGEGGLIRRVSAFGGSAVPVAIPQRSGGDVSYHYPHLLPDGRHFIFVRVANEGAGIYVRSLEDPPNGADSQMLVPLDNQTPVVYSPFLSGSEGHLLYMQNDTLMAQPFDPKRLALTGEAVPVVNGVARAAGGRAMFSIAMTGAFAYRRGSNDRVLRWFGRDGKALDAAGEVQSDLELSPDGTRVVAQVDSGLSVIDLARGLRMPFTDIRSRNGVWSPDGQRIAFSLFGGPDRALFVKPSNGASPEALLLDIDQDITPNDWSPDGRVLIYATNDRKTNWDLWALPLTGDRSPKPLVRTPSAEIRGQFSPDGRWIAYQSNETGDQRVYVRPFVETAVDSTRRWTVDSGSQPRWGRDGKALFYIRGDAIWSVEVLPDEEFEAGIPKRIMSLSSPGPGPGSNAYYDVAPDGRFLVTSFPESNLTAPITVTLNWRTMLAQ